MLSFILLACTPSSTPTQSSAPVEEDGAPAAEDSANPTDEVAPADWTFLVYMDGDNDLESYVLHDLNELEAGLPGANLHVIVQADRALGYDHRDGDWTGARRYEIVGDEDTHTVSSTILEELGEVDMADPAVLSDFLLWADENYPGRHVALSLWDHGSGWYLTDPPPGVAWDDSSGDEMSLAEGELGQALDAIVAKRGPLDVLAFDACNMAEFEVAHAVRKHALTLVASEHTVGGEGLQYNLALQSLSLDGQMDAHTLAALMASDAVRYGNESTFSAIDLTKMDAVAASVDALAGLALSNDAAYAGLMHMRHDARAAESFVWHDAYIDLVDLAAVGAGLKNQALAGRSASLAADLDDAVIATYGAGNYDYAGGMTIFFDNWSLDTYSLPTASWAKATRWDELLWTLR